ncbi:hypothetical protein [Deferrisoma camini]|uniref:hypothetical protein n=1 Tax=Deferrisoma camini TaxID=1035120 RepID=UPI00046D173D|nr:hypothetical protein [Deferrisoma camini]
MAWVYVPPTERDLAEAAMLDRAAEHLRAAVRELDGTFSGAKAFARRALHEAEARAAKLRRGPERWVQDEARQAPAEPESCSRCGKPGPFRLIEIQGVPAWYHQPPNGCCGSFAATDEPIPETYGGTYRTQTAFGTRTGD